MSFQPEDIAETLGQPLPTAYAEYLQHAEEVLRDDGLLLYGRDSIIERNTSLGVQRFVSDFLAVGDDSGGRLVVVRFADPVARPFLVDGGALVPNMPPMLLRQLAPSWREWELSHFALPADD